MCREKVRFIRIDGSTDPSKRSELVKHFQEQHDVRGAILSIKAAGVGLTLTVRCVPNMGLLMWPEAQSTNMHAN